MADRVRTTEYRVIADQARSMLAGLNKDTLGVGGSALKASNEYKQLTREIFKGNLAFQEVRSRIQNALETMIEFGATQKQVEQGFREITRVAKLTGRSQAEVARALEKLTDESGDATRALKELEGVVVRASASGERLEDAATRTGRSIAVSRNELDPFGAALARADLQLEKWGFGFISAKQLLTGFLAAVGTVTGAVTAFAHKALTAAIERNIEAKRSVEDLSASYDNLAASIGNAVMRSESYKETTTGLTTDMNAFAAILNQSGTSLWEVAAGGMALLSAFNPLAVLMAPLIFIVKDVQGAFRILAEQENILHANTKRVNGILADTPAAATAAANALANPLVAQLVAVGRQADIAGEAIQSMLNIAAQGELGRINAAAGRANVVGQELGKVMDAGERASNQGRQARKSGGGGKKKRDIFDFEPTQRKVDAWGQLLDDLIGEKDKPEAKVINIPLPNRFQAISGIDTSKLDEQNKRVKEAAEEFDTGLSANKIAAVNRSFEDLANGGIALVTAGLGDMIAQMVSGDFSVAKFAKGVIGQFGSLFRKTGEGLILLGLGVDSIKTGITSGAALVAIGAGLTIVGGAMEGIASSGGRGAAGSASAIQQGFSQSTDRLLDAQKDTKPLVVYLEEEGAKRVLARTLRGMRDNRQIPALA